MSFHIDAFSIGNTRVDLNDDQYTEKKGFAEYTNQTEAGTTRRDVIRIGYLAELSIKITTTGTVKTTFDTASEAASLELTIWDDGANAAKTWDCYLADYTADLVRDTSTTTYWNITATFKDLEES